MKKKLGSGNIQFQGCLLGSNRLAVCLCFHNPPHVPNKEHILAYLNEQNIDPTGDFSLILDSDGNEDVILYFGNPKIFDTFKLLVDKLSELNSQNGN